MNKILYMSILAMTMAALAKVACAYEYADALKTFRRDGCVLWLKSSLPEKMEKIKNGMAIVMLDAIWKDGGSLIKCDFDEEKYRIIRADNTSSDITKDGFYEMCSAPALVSYGDRVYLNIPFNETASENVSGELGVVLAGNVYDAMKSFVKVLPRRKLRVKFISNGNPDLTVMDGFLSDSLSREDIVRQVRSMLTTVTKRAWKKEHDAKLKKLPRKPPVVFGKRNFVFKRSDGTFEIPREAPPITKTITWTETVYADGWGTTDSGENITLRIPIGERLCSREKTLTHMYDYEDLVAKKEAYEDAVAELKNDAPPEINESLVENTIKSGRLRFSVVK